jgi:hypothetical protein
MISGRTALQDNGGTLRLIEQKFELEKSKIQKEKPNNGKFYSRNLGSVDRASRYNLCK